MSAPRRVRRAAIAVIGVTAGIAHAASPHAAGAQSLARRVASAPSGPVQFTFAARDGVCGDGRTIISVGRGFFIENVSGLHGDIPRDQCRAGPVRVVLARGVENGEVTGVRTYVGGSERGPVTDLGAVPAREAAAYLLGLTTRVNGKAGDRAVLAAALADSAVIWPTLLPLARDSTLPRNTRHAVTFWLGRAAAAVATGRPDASFDDEDEDDATSVRTQAVFALSQLPRNGGIPELIEVARTHRDPIVRKRAIFWLSASGDVRALAFFEDVLRGRRG
ncbi:MAG: HEAT repeat domain-containing protein [Gemmatimonadaceae bacterium]